MYKILDVPWSLEETEWWQIVRRLQQVGLRWAFIQDAQTVEFHGVTGQDLQQHINKNDTLFYDLFYWIIDYSDIAMIDLHWLYRTQDNISVI